LIGVRMISMARSIVTPEPAAVRNHHEVSIFRDAGTPRPNW
jgi:hypothetical protein